MGAGQTTLPYIHNGLITKEILLYSLPCPNGIKPSPARAFVCNTIMFQILDKTNMSYNKDFYQEAISQDNLMKNRYGDFIPSDTWRPRLITEVEGRTDYINAVFVHVRKA